MAPLYSIFISSNRQHFSPFSTNMNYFFALHCVSASIVTIFHQTERRTFMLLKSVWERRENNLNAKKYQMTPTSSFSQDVCESFPTLCAHWCVCVCVCAAVCLLSIFKWIHLRLRMRVCGCVCMCKWVAHKLPFIVAFVCPVCRQVRWLNFLKTLIVCVCANVWYLIARHCISCILQRLNAWVRSALTRWYSLIWWQILAYIWQPDYWIRREPQ